MAQAEKIAIELVQTGAAQDYSIGLITYSKVSQSVLCFTLPLIIDQIFHSSLLTLYTLCHTAKAVCKNIQ